MPRCAGVPEVAIPLIDAFQVINKRHHMAQMAGRASTELHTLYYFKDRVVVERGIIIRVRENGIIVLVPRFGIESEVLRSLKSIR